jgi:hypothetical protein
MSSNRSNAKNIIIVILILSNIVCAGFLSRYKNESENLKLMIHQEYRSLLSEVCTALRSDDYDFFAAIGNQYEEICRVSAENDTYAKAILLFLDEAYFEDSLEDRKIIADYIAAAEQGSENSLTEVEITNKELEMYNAWKEQTGN